MSEYIKKEDAEQELQHFCDDMLHHFEMNFFAERARVKDCMDIIRKVPSADVVEVVRCKDCIHNDQCKHRVVMWAEDPTNTWHKDIDYCSYGERKEQEHE